MLWLILHGMYGSRARLHINLTPGKIENYIYMTWVENTSLYFRAKKLTLSRVHGWHPPFFNNLLKLPRSVKTVIKKFHVKM